MMENRWVEPTELCLEQRRDILMEMSLEYWMADQLVVWIMLMTEIGFV